MCDGGPIDPDVLFIAESNELLTGELRAVVCDDRVWYSKAMDDVEEEQHSLLGLDCGDQLSFDPFCELVYGDKQVGVASWRLLERPNQIEPPNHEGPRDGDHLECLGWEVSLPNVVLAPFIGAYDLLGVGYYSGLVEAVLECVPNQGSRHGVVIVDPTVDIAHQVLPLLNGDAALQDPGVASSVEFTLHKNEGLGTACEPSSLCLVCQ